MAQVDDKGGEDDGKDGRARPPHAYRDELPGPGVDQQGEKDGVDGGNAVLHGKDAVGETEGNIAEKDGVAALHACEDGAKGGGKPDIGRENAVAHDDAVKVGKGTSLGAFRLVSRTDKKRPRGEARENIA